MSSDSIPNATAKTPLPPVAPVQHTVMPVAAGALIADHRRSFEANRFVYPVVSRRSAGVSIGINLNPDKVCNFDCIYCQVNRVEPAETDFVDTSAMLEELEHTLDLVLSGELFNHPRFASTPLGLRRLNDFAFSGDGEPTTYRNFDQIVAQVAERKRRRHLDQVKLVLITNASMFHRPAVVRGLATLDQNQGEVWAKLDAGTDAYYQRIERTKIPFRQILNNITAAARVRPLVIQALFMRIDGFGPSLAEQQAFADRLNEIVAAGGKLSLVQIYTVARPPAERNVSAIPHAELDQLAELVAQRTGLQVATYYGAADQIDP